MVFYHNFSCTEEADDPVCPATPIPVVTEQCSSIQTSVSGTCTSSTLHRKTTAVFSRGHLATGTPLPKDCAALPRDCEILLRRDLSEAQKLELILNFPTFSPPSSYQFPTRIEYGKKRSFQHHYLQLHKWLGYSVHLDACLCLPCCLFSSVANNAQNFVQKPVSNWTTFNKKVRLYFTSTHIKCALAMTSFVDAHSGTQPTIDMPLNKCRQE